MKTIIIFITTILFSIHGFGQIIFTGFIVNENNKKLTNLEIKIYEDNSLIFSEITARKFSYNLWLNKYYTIEISKKGYYTKRIAVSTLASRYDVDPYECNIELIKKRDGLDESWFDFPAAIIEYKQQEGGFSHNTYYSETYKEEQKLVINEEK